MEGFSRDLLCGIGKGDAPPPEQRPGPLQVEVEEVELSLGLSLGGRFGVDRKGEKLSRSSSVAAVMTTPAEVVAAPPALPRASSLPLQAESSEVGKKQGLDGWGSRPEAGGLGVSEVGKKQGLDGWGSRPEAGGLGVEHVARLPASGSPSSASSEGEAQKLQGTLIRTSSLPADVEAAGTEESNKRRIAESLKRLLKKKRVDRTSSLTCSASREAAVQTVEEMNARSEPTEKLVSCDETVERNNENCSSGKQLMKGLPSKYQATTITSEDSSSAARQKLNNALREFLGIPNAEHSSSSSVLSRGVAVTSATAASPPCSSLVAAARANSMGDMERRMMQEMPGVFTKGLPNGNRVEGFLYKYRNGEQVRIVCICHGSFLTPSEFVEHAGAGKVEHPLRHIVVSSSPVL